MTKKSRIRSSTKKQKAIISYQELWNSIKRARKEYKKGKLLLLNQWQTCYNNLEIYCSISA